MSTSLVSFIWYPGVVKTVLWVSVISQWPGFTSKRFFFWIAWFNKNEYTCKFFQLLIRVGNMKVCLKCKFGILGACCLKMFLVVYKSFCGWFSGVSWQIFQSFKHYHMLQKKIFWTLWQFCRSCSVLTGGLSLWAMKVWEEQCPTASRPGLQDLKKAAKDQVTDSWALLDSGVSSLRC